MKIKVNQACQYNHVHLCFFFFIFFCLFAISWAAPEAYGGSQARGLIRAVAAGLHHSSQQCQIFNPLSEARNRTRNLMVSSQIRFQCATTGTPSLCLNLFIYLFPFWPLVANGILGPGIRSDPQLQQLYITVPGQDQTCVLALQRCYLFCGDTVGTSLCSNLEFEECFCYRI